MHICVINVIHLVYTLPHLSLCLYKDIQAELVLVWIPLLPVFFSKHGIIESQKFSDITLKKKNPYYLIIIKSYHMY